MSGLLLLLVGSAAAARVRVIGVVEGAAGVVVVAAVEVLEVAEVVAAVGVVAGVGALVAVAVGAVVVPVVATVGVVAVEVELFREEVLAVARGSRSCVGVRPLRPSSFVSGLLNVGRLGHRSFSCLDDAWRAEFGDEAERTRWGELLRSRVAIFDLDYYAIIAAMYALSVSAEGDCYLCVPPDPGIEAAALGASESSLPGTALAEALHTYTLDFGDSPCFFRDSTTLIPLPAPVLVRLADPSGGPVVASSSTVLPCPAGCERYFLLVVDDYTRYTTVFPLLSKGEVPDVLIPWIRAVRLQLREQFCEDCPVLRLHSDKGGEFSSDLLRDFYRGEGILQLFTLPASPQHNGIGERRIGLVMEVARTSMIHAVAPHFLWSFVVRYAAHQLNLWPRVSLPETSLTLCWKGEVGNASVFLFYHPTSRRVFPSQDVTFDESIPFYRLFPYRSAPPPPPLLFLAPGPPPVDPLPPQGPAPSGVSQVDPLPCTMPVEVAVGAGAARGAEGAESEGAGSGGAEPGGVEPGDAEPTGVEPGGAEPEGLEPGGAEPRGTASSGGPADASPRLPPRPEPLSPQQLREWFAHRTRLRSGAARAGDSAAGDSRAGGVGATHLGGAGVTAGAGGTGGAAAADPGGARAKGTGAAETGSVWGAGAGGAALVLGLPSSTGLTPPLLCPPPDQSQPPLLPASPLSHPSPYTEQTGGLIERREPESLPAMPVRAVRTSCRVPRPCPPPVPGTHTMALRPSSVPLHVPLPPPHESSLCAVPDPKTDFAPATSPTVSRLLAIVVTYPSFESTAVSALVAELVGIAAACHLDKATTLVAKSESPSPPSIRAAMDAEMVSWKFRGTYVDAVPPDRGVDYFQTFSPTPKMTTLWVLLHVAAQRDYELHSLDFSTAFLQGSLHEEIWLRRTPGFTGSFPAGTKWSLRRPVYGLRQAPREWNNTLRTTLTALGFTPSTADPSLFLHTDTTLPLFYVLVCVDDLVFATSDTEALTLVKSELQKRHTCNDLGELRSYLGLQITRDRARRTITLTQSHMVHQVLQHFGFQFSSPQPTPQSTGHSLSAPPSNESVEPSGPYRELVGCLMYLMTCTQHDLVYSLSLLARYVPPGRHQKVHWDAAKRVLHYLCSTSGMGLVLGGRGAVVLTRHADASWVYDSATQWSSQGYTFSLWLSTRSSSVLSSSCEAETYAGAKAAQELRWLTYLLTDLGEQPRLPPAQYVNNKAMIPLCQEHKL
ncbi:unnamed protein product [Closterium sp. NIES-54]